MSKLPSSVRRNLPDETRRRLLMDKRDRLKRKKQIQDEYVKLPWCRFTSQMLEINGDHFSVYSVQGKDGLFILHNRAPQSLRLQCPLAVRAIFSGVNWSTTGPVVLDLLQLPDSQVERLFEQIYDDWDYKESRPF